jgi:hypothetical protein
MKKMILPAILLMLTGCDYEVPLGQTPAAPADPALSGIWAGQLTDEKPVSMQIKISGTDYLVTYTEGNNTLTFNGFEVKANDLNLIQLAMKDNAKTLYSFFKYSLTPEGLSVYRLNPEVVSAKCQTTKELMKDIELHRQNPFLFAEPLKFTKSVSQ